MRKLARDPLRAIAALYEAPARRTSVVSRNGPNGGKKNLPGCVRYRTDNGEKNPTDILDKNNGPCSARSAVSTPVVPTFATADFDAAAVKIMSSAYTKACKMLHDKGQPAVVQEIIAGRIVAILRAGERDPDRISERVLTDLGLQRK
jgi:hypothetical protein